MKAPKAKKGPNPGAVARDTLRNRVAVLRNRENEVARQMREEGGRMEDHAERHRRLMLERQSPKEKMQKLLYEAGLKAQALDLGQHNKSELKTLFDTELDKSEKQAF